MSNYKAVISYDGTNFAGIAEQKIEQHQSQIRTVIGELRPLIALVAQSNPQIVVSGRTDKGVHAKEQVISFSFQQQIEDLDCERLEYVINRKLNPEINIQSIEQVDESFSARFDAKSRTYRYFIDMSNDADFTLSNYVWRIDSPLDVEKMITASKVFIGEKDFTSFCKRDDSISHNIREVFSLEISKNVQYHSLLETNTEVLCIEITANAFCWNMVRSIVGVLVDVGKNKLNPSEVQEILDKQDRSLNTTLAPAKGLFLWNVAY